MVIGGFVGQSGPACGDSCAACVSIAAVQLYIFGCNIKARESLDLVGNAFCMPNAGFENPQQEALCAATVVVGATAACSTPLTHT